MPFRWVCLLNKHLYTFCEKKKIIFRDSFNHYIFFLIFVLPEVNGKEKNPEFGNHYEEVDAVQEAMGGLGRWQILVCLAISLIKFPVAWHQLAIVFAAPLGQQYNCTSPTKTFAKDQCIVSINGTHTECTEWEFDRNIFPETTISQVKSCVLNNFTISY